MKRSRIAIVLGAMVLIAVASFLMGCGFKRKLVAIEITPNGVTITGTGLIVHFKAVGLYIHPPDTRDITNSVVWDSAAPQIISIDPSTGIAVSGAGCGTNITISATAYSNPETKSGAVVIGQVPITVSQPPPGCP